MENWKSYFDIDLSVPKEHQENPVCKKKVTNAIDLVLSAMMVVL